MFNFKSAFLIAAGLAAVLYVCLSNPSRANEKPSSRSLQTMADNADNQHADDIYIGPEIGSIAKEQWPELVGMDVDAAVQKVQEERPDLLMVHGTKEGSIVSMDYAVRRVRVWYDPDTRKVTRAPQIG